MSEIRSDRVGHGINKDISTWRDDHYVRCARCGFVCHRDRDIRGHEGDRTGWGQTIPSTALASAVAIGDTTITVDSDDGFPSSGYIYIYADGHTMKFAYESVASDVFTGDTDDTVNGTATRAFDEDDVVYGDAIIKGCPQCGTLLYDK